MVCGELVGASHVQLEMGMLSIATSGNGLGVIHV